MDNIKPIGTEQVQQAMRTLLKYKAGKAQLERRVVANEDWWKLRQWGHFDQHGNPMADRPASGWLFNVIMGKHADGMAAYPEPNILAREPSDAPEARMLSSIIPCILEQNDFEQTYSDALWKKVKSGTAIWAVLWDGNKLNGMGDISVVPVDVLNLFWEPGVKDIQDSRNVFYTSPVDKADLVAMYPFLDGKLKGSVITISKYRADDSTDDSDKAIVVDWYYKKTVNGRKVVHFCKFVDDYVLVSTENDGDAPTMTVMQGNVPVDVPIAAPPATRGIYDDGNYPFVFDPLFPVEGSICGYGYIDIGKSPQEQIDRMDQAILQNAIMASTPRWFRRNDGAVNEKEYADWTKPFVHVDGSMGEDSIRQVPVNPLPGIYLDIRNNKVDELKWCTGNTDVNNGSTPSGITAASAIAALQEASGRSSKDSTKASYRAYARMIRMVIERIRQFYTLPRKFRISGQYGADEYIEYSNANLAGGNAMAIFDIKVSTARASEYTKIAQNELAIQFYNLGFFEPNRSSQALACLDMMDFDGKYDLQQKIAVNGNLQQQLTMWQQYALQITQEYAPNKADGLAQSILGQRGQQPKATVEPVEQNEQQEATIVQNARERAQKAGVPD